jgi:catechol 2,3-dioxygenase-like lactoylglutathione lyase family enzyme
MTLASAELVAFVPSGDLERSQRFYGSVLGLTVVEVTPYACVVRSGVTTLRITATEGVRPQPFTVLGWTVDDIRVELRALADRGVEPLRFAGMGQDDGGVWTAPGGAQVAWFHDPDLNVLSLTQPAS